MFKKSFAVTALLIATATTNAALIAPTMQTRFVSNENGQVDATDFSNFNQAVTGAAQDSSLFDSQIIANGSVFTNDNIRDTESSFDVVFDLTADVSYSVSGRLRGTFSTANAISEFRLTRISPSPSLVHEVITTFGAFPGESPTLNFAGNLIAGQYRLEANSSGFNGDPIGGASDGLYEVDFSVVPEPATVALLSVAACFLRRNRR